MGKIYAEPESATANLEQSEHRFVYTPNTATQAQRSVRTNRPVKPRQRSTTRFMSAIIIVSLLIVFYIWNKITVDRLVVEMNDLQNQYQKIVLEASDRHASLLLKKFLWQATNHTLPSR